MTLHDHLERIVAEDRDTCAALRLAAADLHNYLNDRGGHVLSTEERERLNAALADIRAVIEEARADADALWKADHRAARSPFSRSH